MARAAAAVWTRLNIIIRCSVGSLYGVILVRNEGDWKVNGHTNLLI